MKKNIKDIIKIYSGIYKKPEPEGEVFYFQARHFNQNREFITSVKPDLAFDEKLAKHYLQAGDVLVATKGYDHFAVAYKGINKPAVASSIFMVLRIENKNLLIPEFLAWFINHPKTQNILSGNSKGTSLPSITMSDIGDLEMPIPTIKQQKDILKIQSLRKHEISLQKQIDNLREQYIQQLISNILK